MAASSDVSSPEDEGEGDTAEGLDTNFPYCNNAPSEETDAAFREKIKNMGKGVYEYWVVESQEDTPFYRFFIF